MAQDHATSLASPSGAFERIPVAEPVPRSLCTDCGLSRTDDPGRCGRACQFIQPDYAALERRVHGRARGEGDGDDERFFGVVRDMHRASLTSPSPGAQWSGITTRLAHALLAGGHVDAVVTVAPDPDDRWKPMPVVVTDPSDLAHCRGMRMGYAPLLALIEPAIARGLKRLAVVSIPCQTYPLRALEQSLGLERLFVIGTPCSDNTTTENFHLFLRRLDPRPETITYLEFKADYHVELRYSDGRVRNIPFLQLPISDLPSDFFPLTCRTCVDYTNTLADITVGYMGGSGEQWLLVRNETGQAMLDLVRDEMTISAVEDRGKRASAVQGFLANTERAAGGLPVRGMPKWLRPIVGRLMPLVGPRGLEFARARVEMKAIETVLHLRRHVPKRMRAMVPDHVWRLVAPYGLAPEPGERPDGSPDHQHR